MFFNLSHHVIKNMLYTTYSVKERHFWFFHLIVWLERLDGVYKRLIFSIEDLSMLFFALDILLDDMFIRNKKDTDAVTLGLMDQIIGHQSLENFVCGRPIEATIFCNRGGWLVPECIDGKPDSLFIGRQTETRKIVCVHTRNSENKGNEIGLSLL